MQSLLDHHEWRLQANSVDPAVVERELREMKAGALPSATYRTFNSGRTYLPTQMVRDSQCFLSTRVLISQ